MARLTLPWRGIHMDFHTSELLKAVGSQFDADEFADTLAKARVNSVCCFARCHHGMIYYDSKLNPERIHPGLVNRNMLPEQIKACHKRGIRVPVYTTVQWDLYTAREHPEWVIMKADGTPMGTGPLEAGFYQRMCLNSPFVDWLKAHVEEIFDTMPAVDGLFFDIVGAGDCVCKYCKATMKKAGRNPANKADLDAHGYDVVSKFNMDMSNYVRKFKKDASIYYNSGRIGPNHRKSLPAYTHMEFDALPGSGKDAYSKMRQRGRFERNLDRDCVLHTGKFHTAWGDLYSLKYQHAMEYECSQAMSLNVRCLVGDHMPPSGRLDPEVYDMIGKVYSQVETREPWCQGAEAVVDMAILSADGDARRGISGLLVEAGHQFDVIDDAMDFSRYKLLVVGDSWTADEKTARRLDDYVATGGRVLATYESGMDAGKTEFLPRCMPVVFAGDGPIHTDGKPARGRVFKSNDYADYVMPTGPIGRGLDKACRVMYMKGLCVKPARGATIMMKVYEPLFNRSWDHFSGHRQAPPSGKPSYPAVARKGGVIYFGHPMFGLYSQYAPGWVKQMLLNAIDMLLGNRLLRHNGPSTLETTVNVQKSRKRWIVHLLHYIPTTRAHMLDIVEDVIPVYDIDVSLRADIKPRGVRLVPSGRAVEFSVADGRIDFTVPCVNGHEMVELKW
jgi:hypothetical protein